MNQAPQSALQNVIKLLDFGIHLLCAGEEEVKKEKEKDVAIFIKSVH